RPLRLHHEEAQSNGSTMTTQKPWYSEGLRFECTQCGNCCTGNPGAVWVTEQELQAIAEFREVSIGELKIHHTRLIGAHVSLREYANGDCVFLDAETRRCTIYPVRPAQCRTWPFWNSNLETFEAWEKAHTICPGMNRGDLVQLEVIQELAAVV